MSDEKFDKVKYNNKYNKETYDRFSLMLPKGKKEIIQSKAKEHGESLNAYINRAIDELMAYDNSTSVEEE